MASEGLLDWRLTLGKEWLSGVTPVWGKLMQRAGKGLRSMVVMVVKVVGTCQQPLPFPSPIRFFTYTVCCEARADLPNIQQRLETGGILSRTLYLVDLCLHP